MIEHGGLGFVDEVLYKSGFAPGNISARYRNEQLLLRELIREATLRRRKDMPEDEVLQRATHIRPESTSNFTRIDAGAEYFIGSCLYARGEPAASKYLRRAIAGNPFHVKAWAKLFSGWMHYRA